MAVHGARVRQWVGLAMVSLSAVACSDQNVTAPAPAQAPAAQTVAANTVILLGVSRDIVTLNEGESVVVRLAESPTDDHASAVWTAENPSVASVSPDGTIVGLATGTTMVTVTEAHRSSDIVVTVLPTTEPEAANARGR
jgi:hypothetical protein